MSIAKPGFTQKQLRQKWNKLKRECNQLSKKVTDHIKKSSKSPKKS